MTLFMLDHQSSQQTGYFAQKTWLESCVFIKTMAKQICLVSRYRQRFNSGRTIGLELSQLSIYIVQTKRSHDTSQFTIFGSVLATKNSFFCRPDLSIYVGNHGDYQPNNSRHYAIAREYINKNSRSTKQYGRGKYTIQSPVKAFIHIIKSYAVHNIHAGLVVGSAVFLLELVGIHNLVPICLAAMAMALLGYVQAVFDSFFRFCSWSVSCGKLMLRGVNTILPQVDLAAISGGAYV